MQVGLMWGSPRLAASHQPSCDGAHYGDFAAQPIWRYAASLAGRPRHAGRAYHYLGISEART